MLKEAGFTARRVALAAARHTSRNPDSNEVRAYTNGPFWWAVMEETGGAEPHPREGLNRRGLCPLRTSPTKGRWAFGNRSLALGVAGFRCGGTFVVPDTMYPPGHCARRDLSGLMTPPLPDANSRCPEALRPS